MCFTQYNMVKVIFSPPLKSQSQVVNYNKSFSRLNIDFATFALILQNTPRHQIGR